MLELRVVIDDDDRAEAPSAPWTATMVRGGEPLTPAGVGSTPYFALRDLVDGIDEKDVDE